MRKLFAGVALCSILTGCAGGFVKDSRNALATLRAAYLTEEPTRVLFCRGRVPQPPACVTARAAADAGYAALKHGSEALAIYVETKTDGAKAIVIRILPEILKAAADLTAAVQELK